MSALKLLDEVSAHGVRVVADGTELVLRGPVSRLPAGVVDQLREYKPELMAHLRRPMKHDLLTLAGDAAQRIHEHCTSCEACPVPAAFGTHIAPVGCCDTGRTLWRQYRVARAAALEVN